MEEIRTILTKAVGAPRFAVRKNIGIDLSINAVLRPAITEAKKNFQIVATIGPSPRSIGLPAYQKPGNMSKKNDAVQANAIPDGPHRSINRNRTAVQKNSINPQISHRSGRPIET